jgi:hypothetical protein
MYLGGSRRINPPFKKNRLKSENGIQNKEEFYLGGSRRINPPFFKFVGKAKMGFRTKRSFNVCDVAPYFRRLVNHCLHCSRWPSILKGPIL